MRASDIWNNDGSMLREAKNSLDRILGGSSTSGDCDGVIQSINIAASIMARTSGFIYGLYAALPQVFNPIGDAYYFRSSGGQPGGPYGYSTVPVKSLGWTGWSKSGRNRRKTMSFWGIVRAIADEPGPLPLMPVGI